MIGAGSTGVIGQRIETTLTRALSPERLVVQDESAKHIGHAGARPEGETHFRVEIVAERFAGRPRVERHRLVTAALADLLRERVHALSITALTPAEAAAREARAH